MACSFILLFRLCIMSTGKSLFLAICIIAFIPFPFLSDVRGKSFTRLIKKWYAADLCSRGC